MGQRQDVLAWFGHASGVREFVARSHAEMDANHARK
jgi:hypothetical protein